MATIPMIRPLRFEFRNQTYIFIPLRQLNDNERDTCYRLFRECEAWQNHVKEHTAWTEVDTEAMIERFLLRMRMECIELARQEDDHVIIALNRNNAWSCARCKYRTCGMYDEPCNRCINPAGKMFVPI